VERVTYLKVNFGLGLNGPRAGYNSKISARADLYCRTVFLELNTIFFKEQFIICVQTKFPIPVSNVSLVRAAKLKTKLNISLGQPNVVVLQIAEDFLNRRYTLFL
jgi:hypothetical protein